MRNRFRIEIFDEVKSNDLTLYSDQGVDRDHLVEIMFSNARRFQGNVRAYVYDSLKKKKTAAARLSMETISEINKHKLTRVL